MKTRAFALLVALVAGVAPATAQLATNETEIAEVTKSLNADKLDLKDPVATFAAVLALLPDRVAVMPTENYYYFRLMHGGVVYSGNIRLAAATRDQGIVHFAYGEQPSDWRSEIDVNHSALGAAQGVSVEKLDDWTYRVSHAGKAVTFALNNVAERKPPDGLLTADETLIGPVFDESAMRFFLVFNTRLKLFHYLLDETDPVPEQLYVSGAGKKLLLGRRTGFAFFDEGTRKILVGVNQRASQLNTMFDGPFDQLPENLIRDDRLRDAIVATAPAVRGQIDRLGQFANGQDRFLVHPYMLYRHESDLAVFQRCADDRRIKPEDRPRCFVIDDAESQKPHPRPAVLRRG